MAKASKGYFRFRKVDDFFTAGVGWDAVTSMTECKWDVDGRTLTARLETDCPDRQNCDLLVQVVTGSTLNIYPGQKGSYTMYLDDGVSRSLQPEEMRELGIDLEARGEYRQVEIAHQWKDEKTRTVSVKRVHDGYTPKYEKYFYVALRHAEGEKDHSASAVKINGETIEERADRRSCEEAQGSGWSYDPTARITCIKVMDDAAEIVVEVCFDS